MQAPKKNQNPRTPGEVRVRSNVCLKATDWDLVPGDLIKAFALPLRDLTQKQRSEMMYYERCCNCQRTVFVFMEEGCNYCAVGGHGVPSVLEAKRRHDARFRKEEGAS